MDISKNNATRRIFLGLPAYNEEVAIGRLLEKILNFSSTIDDHLCIVVYDDGSNDRTIEVADSWKTRLDITVLVGFRNRGLGAGLRALVQYASANGRAGDLFVLMDCDDTHSPDQISMMLAEVALGNDIVIASRFCRGARTTGVPMRRKFLTFGAVTLFKLVYPIRGVNDYTCGYRCYRVELLQEACARFGDDIVENNNFSCMVEILLKLVSFDPKICEIPLNLRYDLKPTDSKMPVWNNVWNLLKFLLVWRVRGLINRFGRGS